MVLVKPATVIQWHCALPPLLAAPIRPAATAKVRQAQHSLPDDGNPLWNAIPANCSSSEIAVSQATIGRYMPWRRISPTSAFVPAHRLGMTPAASAVCSLSTVAKFLLAWSATGHERRKVVHFDVTPNWPEYSRTQVSTLGLAFRLCCAIATSAVDVLDRLKAMASRRCAAPPCATGTTLIDASSARSATDVDRVIVSDDIAPCPVGMFVTVQRTSLARRNCSNPSPYNRTLRYVASTLPQLAVCTIALRASFNESLVADLREIFPKVVAATPFSAATAHFPNSLPGHLVTRRSCWSMIKVSLPLRLVGE